VLASVRVEVECGGVRDVTAGFVGNDCDVVANLILIRPTFLGVKGIAHRHVRGPRDPGVGAVRVEKLRIEVRCVAIVVPHRIEPSVGRDSERAEPMPFASVVIVVDPHGRAESRAAIGAADEHHVGGAPSGRLNASQHVNVVVGGGPGMIYR
jgi:hypothetical protein